MRLSDLYEHPHDRGIMTQAEFTQLMADWRKAGEPEDFVAFMAQSPTWGAWPVYLLLNTLAEMSVPPPKELLDTTSTST